MKTLAITLLTAAGLLAGAYSAVPTVYAHIWSMTDGALPASERIRRACPGCVFDVQESRVGRRQGEAARPARQGRYPDR